MRSILVIFYQMIFTQSSCTWGSRPLPTSPESEPQAPSYLAPVSQNLMVFDKAQWRGLQTGPRKMDQGEGVLRLPLNP